MSAQDPDDIVSQLEELISAAEELRVSVSADPTEVVQKIRQLQSAVYDFGRQSGKQHERKRGSSRPASPLLYRALSNEQAHSESDRISDWSSRLVEVIRRHLAPMKAWTRLRQDMTAYLDAKVALRRCAAACQGPFAEIGVGECEECETSMESRTTELNESIAACQDLGIWLPGRTSLAGDTESSMNMSAEDMQGLTMAHNDASRPPASEEEYHRLLDFELTSLYADCPGR